jgi:type IV pilus assembly protein PilQ
VAGFAINTKHVKTQVLVENGGTVVIGGIFTQTEREPSVNKVPLLGDIPNLRRPAAVVLFQNKTPAPTPSRTVLANKTELLIFITPKIVTDRHLRR